MGGFPCIRHRLTLGMAVHPVHVESVVVFFIILCFNHRLGFHRCLWLDSPERPLPVSLKKLFF